MYDGDNVTMKAEAALTAIPAIIFLLCGVLLRHWLLVAAALLFVYSKGIH